MQFLIELLKLQGLVEVVNAPHVVRDFDRVDCNELLEAWLGPEVQGVEDIS